MGAVAAGLGARRSVLTDCDVAMPLLERNRARLVADGTTNVEVACVNWGNEEHSKKALELSAGHEGFDVVLVSDCIVGGFDTERLFESCIALLARRPSARLIMAYEFREERLSKGMGDCGHLHSSLQRGW